MDKKEKYTGWQDAINKELFCLMDKYTCFKILDPNAKIPEGYQFIKLLWTFDVKFDGRKHVRLVGGGHMTERLDVED